jgi:acyl carrier protein
MEVSSVADMIAKFVTSDIRQLEIDEIGPDTALLELGILDSLSMVNLLSYLEVTLGVKIPEDQILPENFSTPLAIAEMICRSPA